MSSRPQLGQGKLAALTCTLVATFGVMSFGAVSLSGGQRDQARVAAESVDQLRVIEARSTIEQALLANSNHSALVGVGAIDAGTLDGAVADRVALVRSAETLLRDVAGGSGSAAQEASRELDFFDTYLDESEPRDPVATYDAGATARFADRAGDLDERTLALEQLSMIPSTPRLVLDEAIAASVFAGESEPTDGLSLYLQAREDIATTGGWLGTEPEASLESSDFFEFDEANALFSNELAAASDLLESTGVVEIDRWVRSFRTAQPLQQPGSVGELGDLIDTAVTDLDQLVSAVFSVERTILESERSAAESRAVWWSVASIVSAAVALISLVFAARVAIRWIRQSKRHERLATVDPLTGVGSRHALEMDTEPLLSDTRFERHLVAMVDLDRFKLINDVHGHAAGDAVLVAVAHGLEECSETLQQQFSGADCTVIRLGGDEFLLSLHTEIDTDASDAQAEVERLLDALRRKAATLEDGTPIPLAFSFGMTSATDSPPLDQLMRDADLALYEQKSARAAEREQSDPVSTARSESSAQL